MIGYALEAEGLLKWARYLDEVPKKTNAALSRALNAYGEEVVRGKAQQIADEYDLSWSEVMSMIEVKESTPQRLVWQMDSSAIEGNEELIGQMGKGRTKGYEDQTLVKIVDSGDERVCPICQEAVEKSPWAVYELKEFLARHKNFLMEHPDWVQGHGERTNLLHPNCRCTTQAWSSKRRVSVTFGAKGAPPELLTGRRLGEKVAGELKVALKVTL